MKIPIKKSLMVAGAVSALSLGSVAGVSAASVQADGGNRTAALIEKISSKFNVNQDEVKAVFDEQREENQAARDAELSTKLDQLVSEGKLTAEQKDAISEKRVELMAEREANKESGQDKTDEARKAEHEIKKAGLETWAEENGIDKEYLGLISGHGDRGFRPHRGDKGMEPSQEES